MRKRNTFTPLPTNITGYKTSLPFFTQSDVTKPRVHGLLLNMLITSAHYLPSSRETFIEREPGETANDRNDRAIRVAAKWYSQHLKSPESGEDGLRVVLLTNDQGNKQKAEESSLLVYRCKRSFSREGTGVISREV